MIRLNKILSVIALILLITFLIPSNSVKAYSVATPTIITIEENFTMSSDLLTGTTAKNTEVMIYLDGIFIGDAKIEITEGEVNNFSFNFPANITEGEHLVNALAKDNTSLLLSDLSNTMEYSVKSVPAPTMIEPNESTVSGKVKPYIKGLIPAGTFARIYIDGVYNGKTEILEHESGTANFAYKPFLNLKPGYHTAWAITETANGKQSKVSNVLNFRIEEKYPAPVLIKAITNYNSTYKQPFIVGVAKNDSKIKVFVDQKLYGEFLVKNHVSGTANFAYQVPGNLSSGSHMVYATATDTRGKESIWSNIIRFNIESPVVPIISTEGVSEEISPIAAGNGAEDTSTNNQNETDSDAKKNGDINNLIKENVDEDEQIKIEEKINDTGLIDENKEQQGKLKLNLIIFIVFLVSVIAWIFWVNRELIKEKKQEEEKEKNDQNKGEKIDSKTNNTNNTKL